MTVDHTHEPHASFDQGVSSKMLEPTEWLDTEPGFLDDLVEDVIKQTPVRRAFDGIETRELSDLKLFAYYFG